MWGFACFVIEECGALVQGFDVMENLASNGEWLKMVFLTTTKAGILWLNDHFYLEEHYYWSKLSQKVLLKVLESHQNLWGQKSRNPVVCDWFNPTWPQRSLGKLNLHSIMLSSTENKLFYPSIPLSQSKKKKYRKFRLMYKMITIASLLLLWVHHKHRQVFVESFLHIWLLEKKCLFY